MDADGADQTRLTGTYDSQSAEILGYPVWSPDGRKIAFVTRGLQSDGLSVINADGTNLSQLQTEPFTLPGETTLSWGSPVWSPDGGKIAFVNNSGLYVMNADGSGQEELDGGITERAQHAWSPDGQKLAFFCSGGADDLCVINTDGTERTRLAREVSPGGYPLFATWGSG
jgi:Tol biopolymer transport system component